MSTSSVAADVSDYPPAVAAVESAPRPVVPARSAARRRSGVLELGLVLLLGGAWFFWGLDVGDFIGTEGLRALIAKEMLASDNWLVPTVHGRTYLRKPPLYAWTTAGLATLTGGLDETVARTPSAVLGLIYVLTMHLAARRLIAPEAGPAAAVFAGANWFVLEYGMRAELDIGVLTFGAIAHVLLFLGVERGGAGRWTLVALAYAAALLGSFWKAPHVLLGLWLTLIAWWIIERRAGESRLPRVLLSGTHLLVATIAIAVVAGWYALLSSEAGASRVASFTALEVLARTVPRSVPNLIEILLGPLEFAYVALPFNAFAAVWLLRGAPAAASPAEARVRRFVAAWLIANMLLLLVVPAKAPRYWFQVFPPLVLMAAAAWRGSSLGLLHGPAARTATALAWGHALLAPLVGATLVVLGALVANDVIHPLGVDARIVRTVLLTSGAVACIAGILAAAALRMRRFVTTGALLVLALIALKPPQVLALRPQLAAAGTLKPTARAIEACVPAGETIYVLSEKRGSDRSGELGDLGFYSDRRVVWPRDDNELALVAPGPVAYVLARKHATEDLRVRFGAQNLNLAGTFEWPDAPGGLNLLVVWLKPDGPP